MSKYLTERQKQIIHHLSKVENYVTGGSLASFVGVSGRTIRNDIDSIKKLFPDLIESSNRTGYLLNKKTFAGLEISSHLVLTPNERLISVLRELVINDDGVDLFDLSEAFFVSESTIGSDIHKLRKIIEFSNYELKISVDNNIVILTGEFSEKASLFIYVFKKKVGKIGASNLSIFFDDFDVDQLMAKLIEILIKHELFSRYLSIDTLILYLLLIAYRADKGYHNKELESFEDKTYIEDILSVIVTTLNKELVSEYKFLINRCIQNVREMERIESKVRNDGFTTDPVNTVFMHIMEDVEKYYDIELLANRQRLIELLIHMKIAIYRAKKNIRIANPIKKEMKTEYPFLFDIGFYIAKRIKSELDIYFNSEEVSYIVAHLINYQLSDTKSMLKKKVQVMIVTLEGKGVFNYVIERVSSLNNRNYIDVQHITSLYELRKREADVITADLIISTTPIYFGLRKADLIISPSITVLDEFNINSKLKALVSEMKKNNFNKLFVKFFNKDFSKVKHSFHNPNEAIEELTAEFVEKNYIEQTYVDSILEREHLLSTSIPTGVALPHATTMFANQSSVMVCFLEEPMIWGNNKVQLILLFIIAQDDIKYLHEFYKLIAKLAMDEEIIQQIITKRTLKEFRNRIYDFYVNEQ